ncbi:MAG: hypothetical protein ACOYM5_16840 [Caulobacter sp.]
MRTYTVYIWDARYTVPSLAFIDAGPDVQVADLARRRLEESHHHLAVEVLDGDTLLLRIARENAE